MTKNVFPKCSLWIALWLSMCAWAGGSSLDCAKVQISSSEAIVCKDKALSALDRQMARVYASALEKAGNQHPPLLKAEQRGWIKGRNNCWKSTNQYQCITESYQLRIAELQARYRLLKPIASVRYACDGNLASEVTATFFNTDPASVIAERGDAVSFMVQQRSASGARYQGRNESLWEHQGEATVVWGHDTPEMRCVPTTAALAAESAPPPTLTDTRWQLRAFLSMDDAQGTTTVAEPSRYTVAFGANGQAAFRLDCNRGAGSWQADALTNGSGALHFGQIAFTRARCGPQSLDQRLARQLPYVRSFTLKNGRLFMALMADGGIYEWEEMR